MARLTNEELQQLMQAENVDRIWSYSRVSSFKTSKYEYLLHYLQNKKPDRDDSIYCVTGNLAHTILEKYHNGEIPYEKMIDEFEDGFTMAYEVANLKFDRTDETKNEQQARKYHDNLVHFFKHYTPLKNPMMEQFVKIKVGDNLLQGYIDATVPEDDGMIHIIDFKTSSMYTGKNLISKSQQLCLYVLGLSQAGIPIERLKASFNFLKYATIEYTQANKQVKSRNVERMKIGESIKNNLKMWLRKFGYTENEIVNYCDLVSLTNSLDVLPEDVQKLYTIKDCYVEVPLSKKLIYDVVKDIDMTIKDIELREQDYYATGSDKCFWDDEDSVKKESFYFANLCEYSAQLHKPYALYLETLEKQKQERENGNVFNGVGSEVNDIKNGSTYDLSWLNDLAL